MTRALRVLLIDDSPAERLLAEEAFALTDELLCTLTTAPSGLEALTRFQGPNAALPDVILLDINMPGMSGFEVLATLKADPKLRVVPVVMFSTSPAPEDVTQAYTLHASAYLLKSPEFHTFLEQIETFILFWSRTHLPYRPTPA
ncbi:response regulator [Deinococcus sp. QL22]|uniref:response regulator n=1 Tax=Deinococcus sp. QL22 TaxID=2939437 RepID=UPI0020179765|nr:response regulator [Deinococcus sp. QL22]UQN05422.1 response regulator [Deinococcus sp. QL22]